MPASAERIARLREAMTEAAQSSSFDAEYEKNKAKVRHRALLLLNERARSVHEITERLRSAEFEPQLVDDVVADLLRSGLLDDRVFAAEWARQRHETRGKSRRALLGELAVKGVDPAIAQEAVATINDDSEEAIAREIADKKASGIRTVPQSLAERDKHLRRIVGMLARRGYPEGMSLRIAKEALDHRVSELGG